MGIVQNSPNKQNNPCKQQVLYKIAQLNMTIFIKTGIVPNSPIKRKNPFKQQELYKIAKLNKTTLLNNRY